MACFGLGGPSYTEIKIEGQPFLPITLNLPSTGQQPVEIVNQNGELYSSISKQISLINGYLFIEQAKPKLSAEDKARMRKELEALQKQEEDLLRQVSEREQELTTAKREI